MGTYTANYQLYMPSIGEQGWGDLMNGNLTTIDTTMKGLDGRIGTLETEVSALEGVSNGGNIVSKSITNSGTITSTGLITANGGIKGNLTGNVTGRLYVNAKIASSGEVPYADTVSQTTSCTSGSSKGTSSTITVSDYVIKSLSYPVKLGPGVYIGSANNIYGSLPKASRSVTFTMNWTSSGNNAATAWLYKNGTLALTLRGTTSGSINVVAGDTLYCQSVDDYYGTKSVTATITVNNAATYYLQEA